MTIEQRKIELINWITSIQREDVIEKLESFRQNAEADIPNTILELLEESSAADPKDGIEHTSARQLLGR